MNEQQWMESLAEHYEAVRDEFRKQPQYRSMVVLFDVDGTILDHRRTIYDLLKEYDRRENTSFFEDLHPEDIYVSEDHLARLLDQFEMSAQRKNEIVEYYEDRRWSEDVILESHRPYQGVMDVIRWFQLQPNTRVGLNTARPESLREKTLKSLNLIGEEYKVSFDSKLLHMNQNGWMNAIETKIGGIRYFEQQGHRIVAMLDNEPANLSALSDVDFEHDFLLLHAETCFDGDPEQLPEQSLSGRDYQVTNFLQPRNELDRIQFVWNRINTFETLTEFLNSSVQWGKFTVRSDPDTSELILRSRGFDELPQRPGDTLTFLTALEHASSHKKSVQLELDVDGNEVDPVVDHLERLEFPESRLGFRLGLDDLRNDCTGKLIERFPEAHREVSLDFMQELIMGSPEEARSLLTVLQDDVGIDRFSLRWQTYGKYQLTEMLREWGFEVNLTNIPGLVEFLGAEKLHPDSVTLSPTFSRDRSEQPEGRLPDHVYRQL